jgi:hypothetical protein
VSGKFNPGRGNDEGRADRHRERAASNEPQNRAANAPISHD